MLHRSHLGDQIGRFDQRGLGVAARDHDVEVGATGIQRGDYPVEGR